MRLIGHVGSEAAARKFADCLLADGIEVKHEFDKDSGWAIWVSDEDKTERATAELGAFLRNPEDSKYSAAVKRAAELKAKQEKEQAEYRKRFRESSEIFRPLVSYGLGPLTIVLILISVAVFLLSNFGTDFEVLKWLYMTKYRGAGLPEVKAGQAWRLISPIFIHSDILHILFNMLWLKDLGSMIEARQGTWKLVLLVGIIGVFSNLGQFIAGGAKFGGMSGVVYGLLGYVWLRGKFDPASGFYLHPWTVIMMIIWFFACYTGLLGNVANTAHAVGLVMGCAWGYLSSLRPAR